MRKTWKKSPHKRKSWAKISWKSRYLYYMKPLLEHLMNIWQHQLPLPTLLKCVYSCVLIAIMLVPVIYPVTVLGLYYGIFQYIGETHFNITFPWTLNLIGAASDIWCFQITDKKHLLFLSLYLDRYRVIISAVSSTIDYMRIAVCFVFG